MIQTDTARCAAGSWRLASPEPSPTTRTGARTCAPSRAAVGPRRDQREGRCRGRRHRTCDRAPVASPLVGGLRRRRAPSEVRRRRGCAHHRGRPTGAREDRATARPPAARRGRMRSPGGRSVARDADDPSQHDGALQRQPTSRPRDHRRVGELRHPRLGCRPCRRRRTLTRSAAAAPRSTTRAATCGPIVAPPTS